jgi:ferric-dicitrate binding protein FerR (iron transport regulator)
MSSCRHAHAAIMASVRQQASEAERLCLEEHLQICPDCRIESVQWKMMESLRDDPGARLSSEARSRILRHLMAVPQPLPTREKRPLHWARPALALAAGVLIVALGIWRWPSDSGIRTAQGPTSVRAQTAGVLAMAGAKIEYQAGTSFDVQPERRELHLMLGEVDIEVTPGGPGHFSVVTPRFVVQVLGTRFVVGMERVRTLHGVVRVVDGEGRELSIVPAGQSWQLGQAPLQIQAQVAIASPSPAPRVVDEEKPAPVAPKARALAMRTTPTTRAALAKTESETPAEAPSADKLLSEARMLLASGDAGQARARVAVALTLHPTIRQRASAELLTANSLLAERRYSEAMVAFRRTATIYANQPEGELATFALGQLLAEQGLGAESQTVFRRYLDSYSTGQFVAEVRRRLHHPIAQDPLPSP